MAAIRRPRQSTGHVHTVQILGDGFACWKCCRVTKCAENLARLRCTPPAAGGHALWRSGDGTLVFCAICGAYSRHRVRLLKGQCAGRPGSDTSARALKLLKAGNSPQGRAPLGRPSPDYGAAEVLVGPGTTAVSEAAIMAEAEFFGVPELICQECPAP